MKTLPLDGDENPCRPRHFKPTIAPAAAEDAPRHRQLDRGRRRLATTATAFLCAFAIIGLRVAQVTLLKGADSKLNHVAQVKPPSYGRGEILDRNGAVLATTLETASLFANPHLIKDPATAARQLAEILPDAKLAELSAKISSDKSFVWLHRHLTPAQQYAVNALGIPGLDFEREEKRIYPAGALAAHVVGYNDVDGKGLAGVERSFDGALARGDKPVQLSLDIRLQEIVKDELTQAVEEFTADGATGIVLDLRNGEVLSLVSLPDFDPNNFNTIVPETIFNRGTLGVYEMGSVFKIYNTALALENHKVGLGTVIDATHPIPIGRFTIHDHDPFSHPTTVSEIFMKSSNIGSAKMAEMSGIDAQKDFIGRLGLLRPATIEIPEIGAPMYPNPWHEINLLTIAFGHGIAVSPIQMAVATGAVVNGGILRPATVIKQPEGFVPPGTRVLSERTSEEMRKLMRLVVTDGTAKSAKLPPYLVGGKTGTADKVGPHGGYLKNAVMASFMSAFPINDPHYLVFVMLDNPHGTKKTYNFRTAGWNAAPTTGRIIARMAPLFRLSPIEETPEVLKAISIDLPGLSKKIAAN